MEKTFYKGTAEGQDYFVYTDNSTLADYGKLNFKLVEITRDEIPVGSIVNVVTVCQEGAIPVEEIL